MATFVTFVIGTIQHRNLRMITQKRRYKRVPTYKVKGTKIGSHLQNEKLTLFDLLLGYIKTDAGLWSALPRCQVPCGEEDIHVEHLSCHNKIPQARQFKKQIIFSQWWRLEVSDQDSAGSISGEDSLSDLQTAISSCILTWCRERSSELSVVSFL